jgi:uncharacterized membrane protein
VLYGLLAALGFGFADFLTAISSRRIGTFVTLLVSQVVGAALILTYLLAAHPRVGGADATAWTLMLLGGVAAGLGYFALYRALELGPIALVSPIVGADAAFGVVLFVIFLDESLTGGAIAAIVITILGVLLASFDPHDLSRRQTPASSGIRAALVSLVAFTVGLFAAGYYTRDLGWFLPLLCSRAGTMVVLLGYLGATRARDFRPRPAARSLVVPAVIGAADLLGFAAFVRGTEVGPASIVTAVSATFALIPVAGGILVFGERPAASQAAGVALVIGGLVLLGLTR